MSNWQTFLARHSLIAGLALMFALTWPIDLANAGLIPFQVPFVAYLFLGWGFIVASLVMTGLTQGRRGVVGLLRRYLIFRVGVRWYVAALLLFPAIWLAAALLNAAWTGEPPDFGATMAAQFFGAPATWPLFIVPFFIYEAIANGEEMGWRGYVLPRLQARHNALIASLILGLVWGLWHLPKFLGPESSGSFPLLMIRMMGQAVLFTWLYNNTRGSLLLATMMHATGNTAGFFLPNGSVETELIAAILINGAAALVAVTAGPERLSKREAKQVMAVSETAVTSPIS